MLKLAFLWHQHQPFYKDLTTGYYHMPWVRLHGVKDYLDMVQILRGFPRIKQTFNMVPSLLEQLDDYARGAASDQHLELSLKKISDLTDEDKFKILDLHFQANYDHMIHPNRRYRQLFSDRKRAMDNWGESDWRDLQCLSNLAWIDPTFKKGGRLSELSEKGEGYTEDEKQKIISEQQGIIGRIIPELKEMMEAGQIEISTSPYFHPIMPLIYDSCIAEVAMPDVELPQKRFQHPEDVQKQVTMAVDLYARLFGKLPDGMWPSEGSVSEDIIPILAEHGIRWIATDEEILACSLSGPGETGNIDKLVASGDLYRSYCFSGRGAAITIFFRDHTLSDNIGFVYSRWDAEKAAADFLNRLDAIHRNLISKKIKDPIISVILDGENAWEYYPDDGHDFLNALYTMISKADWLETTTFSQYLSGKPESARLEKIHPGSWINHNFSIWIGHREDNKAWDLLSDTREDLLNFQESNPGFDKEKLQRAWTEIYIAEGSDWCWWFGDDHVGPNNDDFDRLFRSHLANVYKLTDRDPPVGLLEPVRSRYAPEHLTAPIEYISPTIDGKLTHYFEWQQAGFLNCLKSASTMHRSETVISGIWFGFDQRNLYLRIDKNTAVGNDRFEAFTFDIEFLKPREGRLFITGSQADMRLGDREIHGLNHQFKEILEISIPLMEFHLKPDEMISLRLEVKENGRLLEIWPVSETIRIELPRPGSAQIPWVI